MDTGKPKLLNQLKNIMRIKHYSLKTEKSYIQWVRRYIYFHNKRHQDEMGALDVQKYLGYLAVDQHVSASTQNQVGCIAEQQRSCDQALMIKAHSIVDERYYS